MLMNRVARCKYEKKDNSARNNSMKMPPLKVLLGVDRSPPPWYATGCFSFITAQWRWCALTSMNDEANLTLNLSPTCFFFHPSYHEKAFMVSYFRWIRTRLGVSVQHHVFQEKKIKSSLYSLNALSGVTSERCPSPRLCAHQKRTSFHLCYLSRNSLN